ncbi:unnamed protein product [Cylindrotheca closterium]|uniref:HSF-type DNA-binding domain-containing protein n=1 Tax=Cylindrotheca closterium TaxID=2856 RepID=A0AAD2GD40_9STRA|nr:unnamed protein product [Cylindrotheca closterium]
MDQMKVQAALSEMAANAQANSPGAVLSALQAQGLPPNKEGDVPQIKSDPGPTSASVAQVSSLTPVSAMSHADQAGAGPQALPSGQEGPGGEIPDRGSQHHPVAEFLYQLTKMLTDDNSEIIEWVDGRIKVHHPERLEAEVLHKYFRHSKFASFQRQLNYFGFRKIAGKGKMSPCSYVNENATSDIRSLLLIKRKTNGSAARKAAMQQRAAMQLQGSLNPGLGTGIPGLAGAPGMQGMGQGAFGLNQLQMQQNPLSQLLAQQTQQQRNSWNDLQQLGAIKPNMPSIEQLQAQLATLSKQQAQGGASAALNAAALSMANGGAINFAQLQGNNGGDNPATAALNAAASQQPAGAATAAMNAANSAPAGQQTNLFDSATNLKSLLGNDQVNGQNMQQGNGHNMVGGQNLLNRLPSTNNMFSGNISSASLGGLLASSNRLSSLLSLNSFLSRDPSLADLAMMPNGTPFAAFQQNQQQMTNNYNQNQQS